MTILITGANRGIGRTLFDRYSARGETVIGTSRSPAPDESGRWLQLDVTDPQAHCDLSGAMAETRIDLLICNAGVYVDKGEDLDHGFVAKLWADTFAANVTGVFQTVQALLPSLALSDQPRVAIISSRMGSSTNASGGSYIYRASKAAVLNLGCNLALDLKPRGIAVGIYHPGWVRTDMGSARADLSVDESVTGLIAQFDALSLDTTGRFLNYDGTPIGF
ncbi:MAG: SDR family NAD(P)-dependent oxidoreductase [Pseudomonadota bacterium]